MKNTHFLPCCEINYHPQLCPHNIVLVQAEFILLRKVASDNYSPLIPSENLAEIRLATEILEIGTFYNSPCGVVELEKNIFADNSDFELKPIREGLKLVSNRDEATALARAIEFNYWVKHRNFCSNCGEILTVAEKETAKICKACNSRFYPVLSPAIIVAITDGTKILLAHNRRFREGLYSLVAGFVESGESLEQALKREVFEETGLQVKNIKYFSSQPWPFPNSLMMGFTAEYESGEITPDMQELTDVQWFDFDNLPLIPTHETIARRLIDYAISSKK